MSRKKPKSVTIKSKQEQAKREFIASLEARKECRSKALKAVESLLESCVSDEKLLTSCQFLNQESYKDVREERAIVELCGYPLCCNKIKVVSKQYHISSRYNKVFDITDRKLFCSNNCYKASQFLELQLPDCPLWLLDKEESLKSLQLLQHNEKSDGLGQEVLFEVPTIKHTDVNKSLQRLEQPPMISRLVKELGTSRASEKPAKNSQRDAVDKMSKDLGNLSLAGSNSNRKPLSTEAKIIPAIQNDVFNRMKRGKPNMKCAADMISVLEPTVQFVKKCIKEWLTLETVKLLLGPEKYAELFNDQSVLEPENHKESVEELESRRMKLLKKLDVQEMEDLAVDEELTRNESDSEAKKNIPSFDQLKRESKKYNLQVEAFYKGKMEILNEEDVVDVHTKATEENRVITEKSGVKEKTADPASQECVLPLIDSNSQKALRRRIVLDKLRKANSMLCHSMDLSAMEVTIAFREVIQTFNLQPYNISFKPDEWKLVSIIIAHLLAVKDWRIRDALQTELAKCYFASVMENFQTEPEDLEFLADVNTWMVDHLKSIKPDIKL